MNGRPTSPSPLAVLQVNLWTFELALPTALPQIFIAGSFLISFTFLLRCHLLRGFFSQPVISLTHGGWGPRRDWAVRRRQTRIGAFAVTRLEHSTCFLNEVMESFKLNLRAN